MCEALHGKLRLTNTKQAQLPGDERVGDALRDNDEVLAVHTLVREFPNMNFWISKMYVNV